MRASADPVINARGYVRAAKDNVAMAVHLLPQGHPEEKRLMSIYTKLSKAYAALGGVDD